MQTAPAVHETQLFAPLQTRFVPHDAPRPFGLPSTQTGAPLPQAMTPLKHGFGLVVHDAPALHVAQVPVPLHTWFVPQMVPGALFAVPSVHTGAPVAQEMTPCLQMLGLVVHVAPALQATHAPPPLQTCPTPQLVPALAFIPFVHTAEPELQSVVPLTHGAPGFVVHAAAATQAPQFPLASHTWLVPHVVPAGLLLPSMHASVPLLQLVTPFRQPALGFAVQGWLALHAMQFPLGLQTWFMPQTVPAGRLPESMQTAAPVVHETMPSLQVEFGFVLHGALATHATHAPALHTRSGPHAVPAGKFVESRQTVEPVEHEVTPALHGAPGLEVQELPATHMPQKPFASQTCPDPQPVPAVFGVPSTQTAAPVAHETRPLRQSAFGLVEQLAPSLHMTHAAVALQTLPAPQLVPGARGESLAHTGLPD